MGRRRRRRKFKNPLDYIAIPDIGVSDEAKKGIFVVIILLFGALCLLGLFGMAGNMGRYLAKGQELAFGWGKWVFPFILFVWGFFLYREERTYFRGSGIIGLILALISIEALLHFFLPIEEWELAAQTGEGGGFLGLFLAAAFMRFLGFWGSLIVLFAMLLIAFLLVFDTSLVKIIGGESIFAKIFSPFKVLFGKLFNGRDEEDEEEKDDDAEDEEEEEENEDEEEEEENEDDDEEEEEEEQEEKKGLFSKKKVQDSEETGKEEDKDFWRASKVKIDLPVKLLAANSGKPTSGDIKNNSLIIEKTLENFGINVEMGEINVGPTVTQYTFRPVEGVKLSRITTLNNDLALALAAHPLRIEAPIPGRALVGIEVPNKAKAIVGLKEILESKEFKVRKNNLTIALGKDVSGQSWVYNINRMPHLLVAGATNSGKSVCLNSIIVSLLYQNNPEDLRFIMVDPKRVELTVYNGIPHLLTPVITNVNKTINALKWCLNEMDRRFEMLSQSKNRNIQAYNQSAKEKMPYIVFIVDELADLMVAAGRDIEGGVIRLAQMARAVGIHLILATQRPSVDVITGLIKANMPSRIAFSVASGVDSKTILDSSGAEKLLGEGDMLFITAEISKPRRIQGAFVSDNDIRKIVNYIKEKSGDFEYIEGVTEKQKVGGIAGVGLDGTTGNEDELFSEAKEVIVNMGKASASLLQRKLSIGYARAARLLDELEEAGIVGPANGAKAREIFISREQYEAGLNQGISGVGLHSRDEAEAPEEYLEDEENSLGEESGDDSTSFNKDEEEEEEEEPDFDVDEEEKKEDEEEEDNEDEDDDEEEENNDEEEEAEEEKPKKRSRKKSQDKMEEEGMYFSK